MTYVYQLPKITNRIYTTILGLLKYVLLSFSCMRIFLSLAQNVTHWFIQRPIMLSEAVFIALLLQKSYPVCICIGAAAP